jgi:hypothetical protein
VPAGSEFTALNLPVTVGTRVRSMAMTGIAPGVGDVVRLDRTANTQFEQPVMFRVVGIRPSASMPGWLYLDGWELAEDRDIVETTVFVRIAGLVVHRGL